MRRRVEPEKRLGYGTKHGTSLCQARRPLPYRHGRCFLFGTRIPQRQGDLQHKRESGKVRSDALVDDVK